MFIRFACLIKNTNKTHLIVRMEKSYGKVVWISGGYAVLMPLFVYFYYCSVFAKSRTASNQLSSVGIRFSPSDHSLQHAPK